jgi:hypothetical protein
MRRDPFRIPMSTILDWAISALLALVIRERCELVTVFVPLAGVR